MSARDTITEKLYNMTQYNLFIIYDNQMSEDENSFVQKLLENKAFYGDLIDGKPHTSHKQIYKKGDIVDIAHYRIKENNYYILLPQTKAKALEDLRSHLYLFFKKQMSNYRPENPKQHSFQGHCPFKIAFVRNISRNEYNDNTIIDRVLELSKGTKQISIDLGEKRHYYEGRASEAKIIYHSRNKKARLECLSKSKGKCGVCGFDFGKAYGAIGKGFLEVHHIKPIGSYNKGHTITADELLAVCSNCHSMIHRKKKPIDIDDLKKIVASHRV